MVRENLVLDERLLEEAIRLSGERTRSGVVQRAFGELARRSGARGVEGPLLTLTRTGE